MVAHRYWHQLGLTAIQASDSSEVLWRRGVGDSLLPIIPTPPATFCRLFRRPQVVFGGFAAKELALRVDASAPKVVVAATCGLEGSKGALPCAPRPRPSSCSGLT